MPVRRAAAARVVEVPLVFLFTVAISVNGSKVAVVRREGRLSAGRREEPASLLVSIDAAANAHYVSLAPRRDGQPPLPTAAGGRAAARVDAPGHRRGNGTAAGLARAGAGRRGHPVAHGSPRGPLAFPASGEARQQGLATHVGQDFHELGLGADSLLGDWDKSHGGLFPAWARAVSPTFGGESSWRSFQGGGPQIASVCILAFVVACAACGCWYAYDLSGGPSPDLFYGYTKRGERVVCGAGDADSFIAAFGHPAHKVRFRFIGHHPDTAGLGRYLRPFSHQAVNAFDVALDLSPFVSDKATLGEEQKDAVQRFLATGNAMEVLSVQKTISWEGWEELASRVRQRLQELGFSGRVDFLLECDDEITVCRNAPWPNLLRSWVMQLVLLLSVVGGCLLIPYMWVRAKHSSVEFRFHVRIEPAHYWDLIRVGICADSGFHVK